MDNLKELLFKEIYDAFNAMNETKRTFGEFHFVASSAHLYFSTLYSFIQYAGLEEEYQKWKQQQER